MLKTSAVSKTTSRSSASDGFTRPAGEGTASPGWLTGRQSSSAGSVDVAPVLHSEHYHDVRIRVDFVDDSIVAASRGVETFKLTDERMPEASRVLSDRTQDRLEGCRADLLGESIEVPEALGSDLDLVQGVRQRSRWSGIR